jgi:glycosyltransferase involved in cell wall biosynthesis
VFGYASCATPEIVTHRPERFLTPPGKIRQLARLIDTYFSQPTGTIRKEKEAITRSVSHFTWPSTARQIIDNL